MFRLLPINDNSVTWTMDMQKLFSSYQKLKVKKNERICKMYCPMHCFVCLCCHTSPCLCLYLKLETDLTSKMIYSTLIKAVSNSLHGAESFLKSNSHSASQEIPRIWWNLSDLYSASEELLGGLCSESNESSSQTISLISILILPSLHCLDLPQTMNNIK